MPALSVADDGSHLIMDGRPFGYVVDTAWSAFVDATETEWRYYLRTRRQQGFTGVAISVLPILHDRTVQRASRQPFALDPAGRFDYARPEPNYLNDAARFVELALEHDLRPLLVALWCCYVDGTWGAKLNPWAVLPDQARRRYLSELAAAVGPLQPVMAVSGDDDFTGAAAVATYAEAADQLRAEAPDCLLTAHSTPSAVLPDSLAASLDLYVYQSGHGADWRQKCSSLARQYRGLPPRRPVINLEPAYERHGHGLSGRFTAQQVRQASWTSVLSGASAGVGYAAHGVWQWHRVEGRFTATYSQEPFPWQSALRFRGADDIGLLAYLLDRHALFRLDAAPELITDPGLVEEGGFVAGAADDVVVVYCPYPREVNLGRDLSSYRASGWDLEARSPIRPALRSGRTIVQPDVVADTVMIFER